jgi:hypothetical protein
MTEYLIQSIDKAPDCVNRALSALATKYLNPEILNELAHCLSFDLRTIGGIIGTLFSEQEARPAQQLDFPFEQVLNGGILSQMWKHVSVSASSVLSDEYEPKNVLDFMSDTMYSSEVGAFNWIQIVLGGELKAVVSQYALRRVPDGGVAPVAWQLAGSDDGINWITIDRVNNDEKLVKTGAGVWEVHGARKPFARFRLLQTATSDPKNQRFMLSGIEIFGSVNGLAE